MTQRLVHAVTKVYYRNMSCFATDSPSKALPAVLRIPHQRPLWHHVVQADHKVCHKVDTKNEVYPHSTKQDTQPIAYLISKLVIPYRTRGGTCYPGVSTHKIWFLADSSTTCQITARLMEDQTLTKTQDKLNITKDG
jgi:hypothetical protein